MKRLGAVGNKLLSFHSDMSVFRHKYMDSCGEMIVSSGLKTTAIVTSAIRAKDGSYRNVATFIVAVQDIAAVCRSHC